MTLRDKIAATLSFVGLLNIVGWVLAFSAFHGNALLLGSSVLAYSFGLRHAVDADHIAAIDNVTRKLMQDGKQPTAVGLMFSLGHSTVVIALSLVLAVAAADVKEIFSFLKDFGDTIGTAISSLFLFALAMMNAAALRAILLTFRRVNASGICEESDLDRPPPRQGWMARWFSGLLQLVNNSWSMYPIGFLFGLGFDTATEIGLLGMAAAEATRGLNIWAIMVFPILFAAGMTLVDTGDNILMLKIYRWSFVKPMRKLYYNLALTATSIAVAILVGGIEALNLLGGHFGLSGPFWRTVALVNGNSGALGIAIIVAFISSWLVSLLIYRVRRYDEVEVVVATE